jgi:polar amino acid transport system substrate-binding protein
MRVLVRVVAITGFAWLVLGLAGVTAADPSAVGVPPADMPAHPLVVAVHELPPSIIKNADGSWSGIAVDLWKRVAAELHLPYQLEEYPLDQLNHPELHPEIDVVLGFAVSKMSEQTLDLTAPYFTSGLGIAVRQEPSSGWQTLAGSVLTWGVLRGFLLFVAASFVLGTIVWWLEREHSPDEYGGSVMKGIAGGALWTIEALFGTSKQLSRRTPARVFAVAWAATCVVLLSLLTAKFSSDLTVNQLTSSVNGPSDLPKVRVGAVMPSSGATYLSHRGINFRPYPETPALLDAVAKHEIDAAVGNATALQYRVRREYSDRLLVLPSTFQNIGSSIGLRPGSPLRKPMNLEILTIIETAEWEQLVASYLGAS